MNSILKHPQPFRVNCSYYTLLADGDMWSVSLLVWKGQLLIYLECEDRAGDHIHTEQINTATSRALPYTCLHALTIGEHLTRRLINLSAESA